MFEFKQENISGITTEIISYETKFNLHILVFPGNPGIASLHLEFAKILIQKANGKLNLHIIAYAGFTKKKPQKQYSLQEELDHKIEVVNHLKQNWSSDAKVVFLGHSIGAWIVKELTKFFQKELNLTSFLLFPFIEKSPNRMQKKISQLLANTKNIRFFLGSYKLMRKLPMTMIVSMVKLLYSHASEKTMQIILEYILSEDHILENTFYLANTEFETLTNEADIEFFETHKESTFLFYCHDDIWAPISQLDVIRKNVDNVKSEIIPHITHDFCVNSDQCETIASKILKYLNVQS